MNNGRHPQAGVPFLQSWFRAPAIQAACIQAFSFAFLLLAAKLLSARYDLQLTIFSASLLQGASAAIMTRLRGLAFWWVAIQAIFPLALVATLSIHLPSIVYLVSFMGLVALYWNTYRTQVPFYPSSRVTWNAVLAELPAGTSVRFADVGSGLGGLVLHLAAARPAGRFIGIEVAPLPWLVSILRKRFRRSAARFLRGDYESMNFAEQDVVFAYLSPAAMPALWAKARREMRPGSLLLSYEFEIPDVAPHFTRTACEDGPLLYGWRM